MKPRKVICLVLAITICVTLFSSCSLLGGDSNKKEVSAYLDAVGPDFEKSKDDLKVFDEQFAEDLNGVTKALDLFKKSRGDFQSRLESLKIQTVPEEPEELNAFNNALMGYYSDSIKIMDEYEQILNYSAQLLECVSPIEESASVDLGKAPSMEEVKAMVKGLKSSITESISSGEKCTPPSYLADSHANFVIVLKKLGTSTDDFIYALQLSDPLRIQAASYRYELLSNKLMRISEEMNKEIEGQQAKMDELGDKLQQTQDDLYRQMLLWQGQYKTGS